MFWLRTGSFFLKIVSVVKQVLKGYRSIFSKVVGFLVLLAFCVIVGFIIAWPAWKLAESSPGAFTAVFLVFAAAAALFFLFRYTKTAWRESPSLFVIKAISRLLLLAGIILFIVQTYARRVPLAFACLIAGILASGFVGFGLSGAKKSEDAAPDGGEL